MSRRGLSKFDTSLLSNDGGKYSPSIRRLRQHYFPDKKLLTNKIVSSSPQPSSSSSANNSELHRQSSTILTLSFKCDDCQKNDGIFQCCHCSQRLCIQCCNKHYKKVTVELDHLHELNDHLLTKILHIKTNLEKQKLQTIEQCQQWRIDTINTINKAHTLIIQTIHDEYEVLSKQYELYIEKEIVNLNLDKNELLRMKKGNLGSLISSPSSIITDSNKSLDKIKKRIEIFSKHIQQLKKFSFQVKLPKFDIDDTLRVESSFGDITRCTSALWQCEDDLDDYPRTSSSINKEDTSVQLKREENGSFEGIPIPIERSKKK